MPNQYTKITQENRFWNKVNKDGSIPAHMPHLGKCWEWTGRIGTKGYGSIFFHGRHNKIHRISWELAYGKIQNELQVLHKCDNRKCVNPAHLFLGNNDDNVRDKVIKNRFPRKLSPYDISIIKALYESGKTQNEIAAEFSVGQPAISRVINCKRWKHVH